MYGCYDMISPTFKGFIVKHVFNRSEAKVKEVKEKLLKGKGYPNLSKIDDIHVICSVLKDFLRNLKEPLLTYTLHGAFTLAAGEG